MVEAWGIRGWSLKVRGEPLSNGSSQNESCYLILLSTLLRFIHQLLDALQYAANRARIVCRHTVLFPSLPVFPSACMLLRSVSFPSYHDTYPTIDRQTLVAFCTKPFLAITLNPLNIFTISGFTISSLLILLWLFL